MSKHLVDSKISLSNIENIISTWIDYTIIINETNEANIETLKENHLWDSLSYNFKETILESLNFQHECLEKFYLILKNIHNNTIENKDVISLAEIGYISSNFIEEYNFTYKENCNFKYFDQENFLAAVNLYTKNRDYFTSLKYAENDSKRLKNHLEIAI